MDIESAFALCHLYFSEQMCENMHMEEQKNMDYRKLLYDLLNRCTDRQIYLIYRFVRGLKG